MHRRSVVLSAFALLAAAPPLLAQGDSWQRRWYWGAETGVFAYKSAATTGTNGTKFALAAGGHWMITGKRSALYMAFDQILFQDSSQSAVVDASATATGGVRPVTFSTGRRIQATIFAIPMDTKIQVMMGGGFAIHQVTNAQATGPFASLSEATNANNAVAQVDTKAFIVMAVGAQYRVGRWAVFANYNYMPSSRNFLLTSSQHALMGGVRYSLTSAHEEVTTER